MRRAWKVAPWLWVLLVTGPACVNTADDNNDNGRSMPVDDVDVMVSSGDSGASASAAQPAAMAGQTSAPDLGSQTPDSGGASDSSPPQTSGDNGDATAPAESSTESGGSAATDTGDGVATPMGSDTESGVAGSTDGSSPVTDPPPTLGSIAGTAPAASCLSYQQPENGQCGSHFCGVTVEELGAALDPNNICTTDPQVVCDAETATVVGRCAREVGPMHLDILFNADVAARDEGLQNVLTPEVRDCVRMDPVVGEELSTGCLDCFIGVALCAAVNCVGECLGGDSEPCDACRLENNCDQSLFACSGLPSPF